MFTKSKVIEIFFLRYSLYQHSHKFDRVLEPEKKGTYRSRSSEGNSDQVKLTANFNHNLDDRGSMVTVNVGDEIRNDSENAILKKT